VSVSDAVRFHARLLLVAHLVALCSAVPAEADIVRLANGRTMNVDAARFEGEIVVLIMRGGGEIRAPRAMIAELLPDEVPFARAAAIEALEASAAAAGPQLSPAAIRALVDRVAERVGLDRKLAHAVVRAESNYDPLAVSRAGAMGLMQIMPVIARQYGVADPFDPEDNLDAGMRHLRGLLGRFDVRRALAAYNAGESAVARYRGIPPYRETQNYIQRIISYLR
jgi:soluble lytic murein transglycosylase-like protein